MEASVRSDGSWPYRWIASSLLIVVMTISILSVALHTQAGAESDKPTAVIGVTLSPKLGQTVHLDGTASSSPTRETLTYEWTLVSAPEGSTTVLIDSSSSQTSFIPDAVGTYKISLVVSDGSASSEPAYEIITINADR